MKKIDPCILLPILGGAFLLLGAAFNWAARWLILLLALLLFALFLAALLRFSRINALTEEKERLRALLNEANTQQKRALSETEDAHAKHTANLLTDLSHSLRVPLSAIQGYADLILLGTLDPVTESDYLEKIVAGTVEIENVLAAHLGSAQVDHPPLHKSVELVSFAKKQSDNIRRDAARCGVSVQVLSSEEALTAAVDAHQLSRIFAHLFENALRYMRREGMITVRVAREGDFARICVRDDGLGLAEEEVANVFDSRFQGSNRMEGKGSGYGLFWVKKAVEANGGSVSAESGTGRGMSVTFTLPLAKEDAK
ncbi:MAG: HAMP domain-containing histidine kinase [Oscillospiraceae bacterium]|nr:HAMP domain-containing histidine kinase [Oscillospiraceae bacterium]